MAFGPQTALAQVAEASAAAAAPLSGARLVGQGVLRFLGFEIYRARLMRKYKATKQLVREIKAEEMNVPIRNNR